MNLTIQKFSLLGMGLVALSLLAGCGRQNVSPLAQDPALSFEADQSKVTRLDFPSALIKAMAHIPLKGMPPLMAPTMLPQDQIQGAGVSTSELTVVGAPSPGYKVQLLSGTSPLAVFGGTAYATSARAAWAVDTNVNQSGPVISKSDGSVTLGHHVMGLMTKYLTSTSTISATAIAWNESGWRVTVTNYSGQSAPTSVAKEVVGDLVGASLPKPESRGALFVALNGQASVRVEAQWQKGVDEYFVDLGSAATNPVNAAIQITASMTRYPS